MKSNNHSFIKVGGFQLNFDVSPTHYSIEKQYSFGLDPCIGQTHPLVSFAHGSVESLNLSIILDEDLNESVNLGDAQKLLTELNRVDPKKRSLELVEVHLGPTTFKGYVTQYRYTPSRFKSDMTPSSIRLDLALISKGEGNDSK
jgi:hypothetical protein